MSGKKASSLDFDGLRLAFPLFGFAVYGFAPKGQLTIEAVINDQVITAHGETLEIAVERLAHILMPQPELLLAMGDPTPAGTSDIFG